jgi:light-regulated signal transduction histidine kinase (bacteriophytochrome)
MDKGSPEKLITLKIHPLLEKDVVENDKPHRIV